MEQQAQQKPQQQLSKQQASRRMKFEDVQNQRQIKGGNVSNQLNTYAAQTIAQRKCSEKEISFLVNELAIDRIKATNILKKTELKQAVKLLINQ